MELIFTLIMGRFSLCRI